MSSIADRIALRDKVDRAVKMATTYLRKAADALHWDPGLPVGAGYWTLLDQALETAADIVEALPADFFEDRPLGDPFGVVSAMGRDPSDRFNLSDEPLERAEKVAAAIRARRERALALRRIMALENTTGRSVEEAAAYVAKAGELRRRHGLEGG